MIVLDTATLNHDEFVHQAEKKYLKRVYKETFGDIQHLMERTGLSRTVLYRKLKKHDIR